MILQTSPSMADPPLPTQVEATLKILNYTSTITLAVYYTGATLFGWFTLQHLKQRAVSKWTRICFIGLSFAITLIYAGQGLQYLSKLSSVSDHLLIYSISQTLFWLSVSLVSLEDKSPAPLVYIGTTSLNCTFEVISVVFLFLAGNSAEYHGIYLPSLSLRIVTALLLATFAACAIFLLPGNSTIQYDNDSKPLLQKSSSSSTLGYNYEAIPHQERVDADETLSSDTESDDESDDDEDEEKLQALQKQRIERNGGWLGYMKEFRIFAPLILPKENYKLRIYLILILINIGIQRTLFVLTPRQLGIIIDKLSENRQVPWRDIVLWIIYSAASSNSCGVGAINEMLEHRIRAWSSQALTHASLQHVMNLSMDFHDNKDSGEVVKAIEQAGSLNKVLTIMVYDILPSTLDVTIAIWYITFLFDVYALLILVAVGISFAYATYHVTILAKIAHRISNLRSREESKLIYESTSNWFTITFFNQQNHTMSRLSRALHNTAVSCIWDNDVYCYLWGAQAFLENLGRLAITLLAAFRISNGTSSVGDFVTLQSYWDTITWPLYSFVMSYRDFNSYLIDAERLLQLFQESPTVQDTPNAQKISNLSGRIVFDNVDFSFPKASKPTIHNFNLTASPGQTIAIVGETGSGKSTLFKLIMRFYDVTAGRITIDDHDLRNITLSSLRQTFGSVPQDPVLFNTSILENVRYGRLDATDAEVQAACIAASIHDKILSFPSGYASKVGERGVKLSGGERQRIAIARAFVKNPNIVLLDEATSAMDSETESKIQSALKRLIEGRTTFVIAHRLSTVVEADCIIVLHQGEVVESGSHEELILSRGRYFDLWNKQALIQG